jgi:hypothetical protein
MKTQDRLSAVDLHDVSDERMTALRREAIRRGVPFSELLGQIADEAAQKILESKSRRHAKAS